jgi:endonuclease YncB( thermonuclease family)
VTISTAPFVDLIQQFEVLDGDTVRCWLDLGYRVGFRIDVRIIGVNAPEIKPHGQNPREWPAGAAVKTWVEQLLTGLAPDGLQCKSVKLDKFAGRSDGDIVLPNGFSLATALLNGGRAKPWNGEGPKPTFDDAEVAAIVALGPLPGSK